jgi:formylmethanofuran dehydrogenase subunit E
MSVAFRDFIQLVEPIKLKEPLAKTLGAFTSDEAVLEYSFIDAVKLAGHVCPTVTGAYMICQEALTRLYEGEIPVRGEITITVYGEPDESVYGVMGQVFSFLTGAAPQTGFKGLWNKFKRKDLLKYVSEKIDSEAMSFIFERMDKQQSVLISFYPYKIPFPTDKAMRMKELLEKVIWEAANDQEQREFQDLWMERVKLMIVGRKDIDSWLKIDERRN